MAKEMEVRSNKSEGTEPKVGVVSPDLTRSERIIIIFCYFLCALFVLFIINQITQHLSAPIYLTYFAFISILVLLFIIRFIPHNNNKNNCRLVDPSKVEAMFVEARTVEPRLKSDDIEKPDSYLEKKRDLEEEVKRLKELGPKQWTEYQVLSLDQMLLEFLKINDLIARARSRLTDLGDYAEDTSFELEKRQYYAWDDQINKAVGVIEDKKKDKECDKEDVELECLVDTCAEKLRAVTRELLDAIADYEYNWALGSAILRALYIYGVEAIFTLVAMGMLPLYYPGEIKVLGLFNWGILGVSGSIAAVLLGLRQSNYVEVGYTLGKAELWRTVLGTGLGLVAGILMHSMIAGGLLKGNLFPIVNDPSGVNVALSIFWAITAGFSLEKIFERIRSSVQHA